eukprot:CAMPEP_0117046898 /NCGR_PEP_ID=MMETSP0472-20121206/32420_1 /TAXON_ID=693140 ORGANISM="Tiarina fusus, Strain LIS" /NCGR_SAMPLE_ID=MMETSP0472 /ASSEMBLY_ACC=CAM_ASM_000603 /LENGTH=201 /DNA_ID=CAMNT_0004759411 /DNA_START=48 /DNA_END=653 /DNA_ORIENTATION=-
MPEEDRSLVWKCGCGKTKLKLKGEPFLVANCCCHSCVAAARFLDEKHSSVKDHTSGLIDGLAPFSFFKPNQVELDTELSPELFGCVKVGPKGKPQRQYVKCCGTQFGSAMSACWGLNRNAVFEQDGETKFVPAATPVNIMKKYAFNPEDIPEPSSNMMPFGDMFKVMSIMMNPFGPSVDKAVLQKVTADPTSAEEVPVTWE